ncbi:MAG: 4Fe-4S cluster-binding domain-containing protein [Firmicutes bacterium]|nr:4Fe-4S cluster-binding domain-containing protein [Bacillota bacterium]
MRNIITYDFGESLILVSKVNSNQLAITKKNFDNKKELEIFLIKNHMFDEIPFSFTNHLNYFKTIYICLHSSAGCNLNCKYCFNKEKSNNSISFEDSKKFIDLLITRFPNAGKYIVDPTGSGEPLLKMDLMLEIAKYCKEKSNQIRKEVLPMLVTNGTLLHKDNVKLLQNAGYIFGISIDGTKKQHDANRIFPLGKGSYNTIIKNIKQIKEKQYLGGAVTLTKSNQDVLTTFLHLKKIFPTISIKPVRNFNKNGGIDETNVEQIKREYTKLNQYLLRKTLAGNLNDVGILLNGDDYFGKFLTRVILNQKVLTRCDTGVGRMSLTADNKIVSCPGAIGIPELEIGTLNEGFDDKKIENIWSTLSNKSKCSDCEANFVCGGECLVVSYYSHNRIDGFDLVMCNLKKHLFYLAVLFKFAILNHSLDLYEILYEGCQTKTKRFDEDLELKAVLSKTNNQYSFQELKNVKDNFKEEFNRIKRETL